MSKSMVGSLQASLRVVRVPDTVEEIGEYCFFEWKLLKEKRCKLQGEGDWEIGVWLLRNCGNKGLLNATVFLGGTAS